VLRHINIKDVKRKHREKVIEQRNKEVKELEEKTYIKSVMENVKYDWRKDLKTKKDFVEVEEKLETEKYYDWRNDKTLFSKTIEKINDVIEEGMTTSDFEYLYGLQISSIMSQGLTDVQSTFASDILQASADTTSYQFGPEFPGSYVNSLGDTPVTSYSKVDAVAFFDTTYGNISGSGGSYTLTTGPEGLPQSLPGPPGSVVSRVNLQNALGITLPDGVFGNLGGTPIEGSAIKRVFDDAEAGKRINFNWTFVSSEDSLGEESVDDYAFVAIKGKVTKIVSVLTKGLNFSGQFLYTVQPEDIVNGQVEIGVGVVDVFDPYVQTSFSISNFGSFWNAGSLGKTTDAADLGMSVNAANPSKKKKDDEFNISKMEKDYGKVALTPGQAAKFMQDLIKDGFGSSPVNTTVNGQRISGSAVDVLRTIQHRFPGGV
jgi:hypothetical protein